jgi:hypothetical protein
MDQSERLGNKKVESNHPEVIFILMEFTAERFLPAKP